MNSYERVKATFEFQPVDYVPLYDQYWGGFVNAWRERLGLSHLEYIPHEDNADILDIQNYYGIDLYKAVPDEAPWPSKKQILSYDTNYNIERDS